MQINTCQNSYTSFNGYKVANVKKFTGDKLTSIDIYKLGSDDKSFITKLLSKIDYKKLCPQLSELDQLRWQKIFDFCLNQFKGIDSKTYLAVSDNSPCGIITYSGLRDVHLNGICAIPNSDGKKIPFVGKSLFLQLFKMAKNYDAKSIRLEAVTDGPFNVIKKYEELGFKNEGCSKFGYIDMVSNKFNIDNQIKTLSKELEFTELVAQKVDMDKFLA